MHSNFQEIDKKILAELKRVQDKGLHSVVEVDGKFYVKGLGRMDQGDVVSEKWWEVSSYVKGLEETYLRQNSVFKTLSNAIYMFNDITFTGHIKLAFKKLFKGKKES